MDRRRRRLKSKVLLKVANLRTGAFETWEIIASRADLRQLKGILNRSKVLFPYRSEKLSKYLKIQVGG